MGKKKYVIGVDLGGTKLLAGILDKKFKVLASEKTKVLVSEGPKHFFKTLTDSIYLLLKTSEISLKNVGAIGLGCPGIIQSEKGMVVSSPNIPFLKDFPFVKKLEKEYKIPIFIGNDVNLGLLGEQRLGAARGYRDVVGIFPGTGVGGALIFNNKIYHGSTGGAGEIGHMIVDPLGPLCGCGQRGCLETFVGRLGIASEAAVLAIRQQAPKLFQLTEGDLTKIKSGVLAKAIKSGDDAIRELVERRAQRLGVAMASLVNLLNPEIFVLGGGLMEALGDIILPEAENGMRHLAMESLVRKVKVSKAKLGDFAIVKGSAVLALESLEG